MYVTNGEQTVTINQAADDNYNAGSVTFTVTVTNNTPTHIATFSVNGNTTTSEVLEGATIEFPENPDDISDKTFVGWVAAEISGVTDEAPSYVTTVTMGTSDVTFYAVFADKIAGTATEVTDVLTNSNTINKNSSTYESWTTTGESGAVYAGQSAGGNESIQLRSNNSNSGIVTTKSGGIVVEVKIEWNSSTGSDRVINIYGKGSTYKSPEDLYGSGSESGSIDRNSTTFVPNSTYSNIGIRSKNGASYLDKVSIKWRQGTQDTYSGYCTNVAADIRAEAELSFSAAEVNASVGETPELPTLTTATGFNGTVEYVSSDDAVAQIMDTETGDLRIVGEGTATITTTFAGNDDYKAGSASYIINVIDNRIATTTTQEDIVIDLADVATLTRLAPVVKDADDNVIEYQYEEWPTEMSFDIVSDDDAIIGSLDNNTGEITLNGIVGTATLKANYNYFNTNPSYKPSECTFTITIESPLANIAALTAKAAAANYKVNLADAIVTYVNGSYAYIQDASGAVVMYKSGHGLEVGNILNGKATVAYQLRNNTPQITSLEGVEPIEGDAPSPTSVAADEWNYTFSEVLSQYLTVTGATLTYTNSKYYVELAREQVQLYKAGSSLSNIDTSKKYTITGFPTMYNSTKELQIFVDPVEEVSVEPSISLRRSRRHNHRYLQQHY